MQPEVDSGYRCAALRYLVDADRDVDVPVAVVLWNPERRWWQFRLPQEGERIEGVPSAAAATYLRVAKTQIEGWLMRGELPYSKERLEPLSDGWWEQVRRLMRFSVRLGPVQPVDCQHPKTEIETLFEALVQPRMPARKRQSRIDGAVRNALGQLVRHFRRGEYVPGFGGRDVRVLRAAREGRKTVVVDAVNLALKTAEHDADALTSRLSRVRESSAGDEVRFVLGYLASPGGLNGEHVMKEWMEHRLDTRLFDLEREEDAFHREAEDALGPAGDGRGLFAAVR